MEGLSSLGIQGQYLLFQIVNFLILLVILRRFLYTPILRLLDSRRERIREGLAEADRVREEAAAERDRWQAELAEERRASQERLREAVARSDEAASRRLAEAESEAETMLSEARAEAEAMRRSTLAGLHDEIAELALRAAGKVLRDGLDERRHRALIDRFLREELGDIA